ncbi:30S ribosomal protein S8 [Candidatus Microgenomates bacterium]|nr:30S ribosomal protein S8 [Candidatus Microgenomates bacterium]
MVGNTVTDLLIQIKNAYLAHLKRIEVPYSKVGERLVSLLAKEGYLEGVATQANDKKVILIDLKYLKKNAALKELKIVSKPSTRIYVDKNHIPQVLGGRGITVLSTSGGLMTGQEAKKRGVGGELICKIW